LDVLVSGIEAEADTRFPGGADTEGVFRTGREAVETFGEPGS
jgi:hypothetical protein